MAFYSAESTGQLSIKRNCLPRGGLRGGSSLKEREDVIRECVLRDILLPSHS